MFRAHLNLVSSDPLGKSLNILQCQLELILILSGLNPILLGSFVSLNLEFFILGDDFGQLCLHVPHLLDPLCLLQLILLHRSLQLLIRLADLSLEVFLGRDQLVPLRERLPVVILQLPQLLLEHVRVLALRIHAPPHVLHLPLHLTHLLLRETTVLLRHTTLMRHSLRLILSLQHLSPPDGLRISHLLH